MYTIDVFRLRSSRRIANIIVVFLIFSNKPWYDTEKIYYFLLMLSRYFNIHLHTVIQKKAWIVIARTMSNIIVLVNMVTELRVIADELPLISWTTPDWLAWVRCMMEGGPTRLTWMCSREWVTGESKMWADQLLDTSDTLESDTILGNKEFILHNDQECQECTLLY